MVDGAGGRLRQGAGRRRLDRGGWFAPDRHLGTGLRPALARSGDHLDQCRREDPHPSLIPLNESDLVQVDRGMLGEALLKPTDQALQ